VDGNTLSLKYNDGKKRIVVPSEATVVNLVPGSIQPGPRFSFRGGKEGDGSWEAAVMVMGRDGITPPM
jgi:hypothetical protein